MILTILTLQYIIIAQSIKGVQKVTREELLQEAMATIEKMTDEEAQAATLMAAGMMAGYEIGRMTA